jgi:hypothetical protein
MFVNICAILAASLLAFSGCSGEAGNFFTIKDVKLNDTDPDISFFVNVDVKDSGIARNFTHTRVTVQDQTDFRQIGRSYKVDQHYMMTVPSSYAGKTMDFVVEFTRTNSSFENISIIKNSVPAALDWLKSSHGKFKEEIPKDSKSPSEITITIEDRETLNHGYGPSGILLSDILGAPLVYFLITSYSISMNGYNFELYSGAAVESDWLDNPDSLEALGTPDKLEQLDNVLGVTSVDLDWALIMKDAYTAGDPFTLWFFLKTPEGACCPCGSASNCPCGTICPYSIGNGFIFAKKEFTPVKDGEPLITGSTINFELTAADVVTCNDLLGKMGWPFTIP